MLLSILIPTHNYICKRLVSSLQEQIRHIDAEILVADDGSTHEQVKKENREIGTWDKCRLLESEKNIGRAAIRNLLTKNAAGEYLLFIDSDAEVENPHFVANYIREIQPDTVICGGILHPNRIEDRKKTLRWKYEKYCEPQFTAAKRSRKPYHNLRTFNFLIPKNVATDFPFDERITKYGYEDTLLGKELQQQHIGIKHIDNPLLNGDIETNEVFLRKTEESLRTLKGIAHQMSDCSSVLTAMHMLEKWHLTALTRRLFRATAPLLTRNLLGHTPHIWLFQLYKLGYYTTL